MKTLFNIFYYAYEVVVLEDFMIFIKFSMSDIIVHSILLFPDNYDIGCPALCKQVTLCFMKKIEVCQMKQPHPFLLLAAGSPTHCCTITIIIICVLLLTLKV